MGFFDRFLDAVGGFIETAVDAVSSALGFSEPESEPPSPEPPDTPEPPEGPTLSDVLGPPDPGELGEREPADIEREQWQAWLEASRDSFSDSAYEELEAMLYDDDYDLDDYYWSDADYDSDTDTGEASG